MLTITCDVCRKKVDDPFTGRTFFYYGEYNVCEACKENMEVQIRNTLRTKEPFTYEWYDKLIRESLSKSISKGK